MFTCKICGSEVTRGQAYCSHCGADVVSNYEVVCPACGTLNGAGNRFCAHCGALLGVLRKPVCSICGAENLPGVKFCVVCGAPVVDFESPLTEQDVLEMRKLLDDNGGKCINIIAKIENQQGVDNIDAIIEAADGIMIARGDMGVEIPLEHVPIIQQRIIEKVYEAGKVVITATQMLDSMMVHPRPTRAETTDVANAIAQGTSAIMLSGETAAGKYPVEALKMMVKIAVHMERNIDYNEEFRKTKRKEDLDITNGISHAACMTAIDLKAKAILAASKTGCTARMISKYRPDCLIGGCSSSEKVCRQLNMSWGILPMFVREEYSSEILCLRAIEAAREHGVVENGDRVVFAGGVPLGIPGRTNLIRVCIVGE